VVAIQPFNLVTIEHEFVEECEAAMIALQAMVTALPKSPRHRIFLSAIAEWMTIAETSGPIYVDLGDGRVTALPAAGYAAIMTRAREMGLVA
jgi:hypothetical protein